MAFVIQEVLKLSAEDRISPTLAKIENRLRKTFNRTAVDSAGQARNALGQFQKQPQMISGSLAAMAGPALIGFGAISSGAAKAVKEFAAFEKALAEVSTLVDDGSISMVSLGSASKALATQFGTSPVEQVKAFYQAISAGASDAATATAVVTEANKLALGGVADLGASIDGLTSVVNAFQVSQENVSEVTDAFFVAVKKGKTTVGELSSNIGKLAPTAKAAGVSIDEMLSTVAALTTAGINTAEATVSANAAIQAIIKPSSDAASMARKLGIEFNAQALKSKGLAGVLREVSDATGGNIEQMAALFPEIRGLKGALALTANDGQKLADVMEGMANKTGAAEEATRKMKDTLAFQADSLVAGLKAASIGVGEQIAGMTGLKSLLKSTAEGYAIIARNAGTFAIEQEKLRKIAAGEVVMSVRQLQTPEEVAGQALAKAKAEFIEKQKEEEAKRAVQAAAAVGAEKKALDLGIKSIEIARRAGQLSDSEARAQTAFLTARKEALGVGDATLAAKLNELAVTEAQAIREKALRDEIEKRKEAEQKFQESFRSFDDANRERATRTAEREFQIAFRAAENRRRLREKEQREQAASAAASMRQVGSIAETIGGSIGSVFSVLRDQTASTGDRVKAFFSAALKIAQPFLGFLGPIGGLLGGVFGGIGGLFGLNRGGVVPRPIHAQTGVLVPSTIGLPRRDSVPAMLTPGERVLSQPATRAVDSGRAVLGQPGALAAMGGGGGTVIVNAPMQFLQAPPTGAQIQRHHQSSVEPSFKRAKHRKDGSSRVLKRRT